MYERKFHIKSYIIQPFRDSAGDVHPKKLEEIINLPITFNNNNYSTPAEASFQFTDDISSIEQIGYTYSSPDVKGFYFQTNIPSLCRTDPIESYYTDGHHISTIYVTLIAPNGWTKKRVIENSGVQFGSIRYTSGPNAEDIGDPTFPLGDFRIIIESLDYEKQEYLLSITKAGWYQHRINLKPLTYDKSRDGCIVDFSIPCNITAPNGMELCKTAFYSLGSTLIDSSSIEPGNTYLTCDDSWHTCKENSNIGWDQGDNYYEIWYRYKSGKVKLKPIICYGPNQYFEKYRCNYELNNIPFILTDESGNRIDEGNMPKTITVPSENNWAYPYCQYVCVFIPKLVIGAGKNGEDISLTGCACRYGGAAIGACGDSPIFGASFVKADSSLYSKAGLNPELYEGWKIRINEGVNSDIEIHYLGSCENQCEGYTLVQYLFNCETGKCERTGIGLVQNATECGFVPTPICTPWAQEIDYCSDGVTVSKVRTCSADGMSWGEETYTCPTPPECSPDGKSEITVYCPDGTTWKNKRICESGVWKSYTQDCPITPECSPEGKTETLEICPDGSSKRWRICEGGSWESYQQTCAINGGCTADITQTCPDGSTIITQTCVDGVLTPTGAICPSAPISKPEFLWIWVGAGLAVLISASLITILIRKKRE